ncbi:MAG: nucleotidyltransferase family protein [Gammaproteobacteria bacterium]|nr:MAG: nucleotidyltransferase family protein [Gammaproteobacteria bacterium]
MADNKYAMILAAGRGERLRPLTDITPKPLLKAGSRLLIEHHLHSLSKAGFNDVVINIGHLGQQIIDQIGDGSQYQLSIQYSDERNGVLETGGGIFKALPLLKSENFLVINGDIWTDLDLSLLPEKIDSLAHLVLVSNPVHHLQGDFSLQGNLLCERNEMNPSWTYSGIGVFSHALFDRCEEGRFPLAPLLREHIADDQITAEVYDGLWFDIGTIERLDALNRLLEKQV